MGHSQILFHLFSIFKTFLHNWTENSNRIQTWIVRVEDKHADHLAITIDKMSLHLFVFVLI